MDGDKNVRQPLAIVGIGCRYPGGGSGPRAFWEMLRNGRDGVRDIPPDRWDVARFSDPSGSTPGTMRICQGAFIDQPLDQFDAAFFGLSPREAAYFDPQLRLLMEVVWEAFEDAGIPPDSREGSDTGVYIGGFTVDYWVSLLNAAGRESVSQHTALGGALVMLSNRLSHLFDLRGPSLTIDTACSSSLVALNYACRDLWAGRTSLAIVGGTNVMLRPEAAIVMSRGGFLSTDARSKAFDVSADGYGRGEGSGAILIKPLEQALADGDPIYAQIVATGVNQDGHTQGIAQPNGEAQRTLICNVLDEVGSNGDEVVLLEAHGTGTTIGDPTEVNALAEALGAEQGGRPRYIGSVKANISHQEAGAGIAGVIKTALCLRHGVVPPQPHVRTPNPAIPFDRYGFRIAHALEPLPDVPGGVRRACVNSFGYGGTNAHALLQESPCLDTVAAANSADAREPQLLCLSARSNKALDALAEAYASELRGDIPPTLADLCHSAGLRRQQHRHRLAVVGNTPVAMAEALETVARGAEVGQPVTRGEAREDVGLVWVFTGMGPQWWAMGRELYQAEPVFREALEQAASAFQRCAGWSILEELLRGEEDSRMACNEVAQPANFVLQAALAALLRHWGLAPSAIVGHSIGEVGAALASGALDLDQAAKVAYHRSRLQQTMAGKGRLLALGVGEAEAREIAALYPGQVSLAAVNSPDSCALSGSEEVLREIASTAEQEGILARLVFGEVAYHSHQMEPLHDELLAALDGLAPSVPQVPLYSTVTGEPVQEAQHNAGYWWRNVRQPVLFDAAMEALLAAGHRTFMEIGPHPILAGAIRECAAAQDAQVEVVPSLTRKVPERTALLQTLATLYVQGAAPDWAALYPDGHHVSLPTYPWQRERYWGEAPLTQSERIAPLVHPFLGVAQASPLPAWQATIPNQAFAAVRDHRIQGMAVFPGAAYVEAFVAAGEELTPGACFSLADIDFTAMLELPPGESVLLRTSTGNDRTLTVHASGIGQNAEWVQHASARLVTVPYRNQAPDGDLAGLAARCPNHLAREAIYADLSHRGLEYGPAFAPIQALGLGDGELIAELELPETAVQDDFLLHPVLVDGCLQALVAFSEANAAAVPVSIGRVILFDRLPRRVVCHGRVTDRHADGLTAELTIMNSEGRVLTRLHDVRAQALGWVSPHQERVRSLLHQWHWQPLDERQPEVEPPPRLWKAPAKPADPTGMETCLELLDEIKECVASDEARLAVLTCAAQRVVESDVVDPAARALWGAARVARNEFPDLDLILLDCDEYDSITPRLPELEPGGEYALRGAQLYRHCLQAVSTLSPFLGVAEPGAGFALQLGQPGLFSSLHYRRVRRRAPGPGEIEVGIRYVGLNFKDVLKAMGRLSHSALKGTFFGHTLGMDSTGVVERVGADVEGLAPGDLVICCAAQGTFRSFVTLNLANSPVVKWPDIGSRAEVAGLAVPFVTAERALLDMARLEPSETVLLHSVAGGVGHAAVQVARHRGARVIATAGSPEKRARALELGADLVFDSRSLDFLDQVRAATDGRGVDVALNFLSGDAQEATLAALAPYGRLVEIGKGDISANRGLSQAAFQENLSFISVDIDRLLAQRTQVFVDILRRTREAFEEGAYHPIPSLVLPATETEDAFRRMWESTHLGRIAVDLTERGCQGLRLAGERFDIRGMLDPQAAYLVTGGFGGFGLRTAAWLADHGARHLVLAGRRGAASDEARQATQALRARGVDVLEAVADVSREQDVRRLLDTGDQGRPPLRGILHCAGVLADAKIDAQTHETFARVFDAKARSALHLHRITLELELELDLFVLFSSVSTVVGNTGQANYAAANAFLDGLAVQRRGAGLPALSVAWGAIAETGMLAQDPDVSRHLASLGVQALETDTALAALEACLQSGAAEAGVFSLDWTHWERLNGNLPEASPYAELVGRGESDSSFGDVVRDFAGMDPGQGQQLLADILAEEAARVLRLAPEQVDASASFDSLGMDSLMAVEFTLAAQERLRVNVRGGDLVKGSGSTRLAAILWPRIIAAGAGDAAEEMVDVASLSEEQVDAMLEQMQSDEQSSSAGA